MPGKSQSRSRVFFVGAGPGDPELLTLKAARLLAEADAVIYAGSLVNRDLLELAPKAELIDSAPLDLDELTAIMVERAGRSDMVVRLHSGDPAFYGAIGEQIARLRSAGIGAEVVPGVSSLGASAAALKAELTVPGVSQTVIITRAAGRTPVPEAEDIASLAAHRATMAVFLSASLAEKVQRSLLEHYPPETPVAVVQRASWPDQSLMRTTVKRLAEDMEGAGMDRTAMILVGEALGRQGEESRLYGGDFSHGYRVGRDGEDA